MENVNTSFPQGDPLAWGGGWGGQNKTKKQNMCVLTAAQKMSLQ